MPPPSPGMNRKCGRSHLELRRKKLEQGVIRPAINRWRRYTNLERITVQTDTLGLRGFGLNLNRDDRAALGVLHDRMRHARMES